MCSKKLCHMTGKEVNALTEVLNARHRASKEAQMQSTDLFLTLYFNHLHSELAVAAYFSLPKQTFLIAFAAAQWLEFLKTHLTIQIRSHGLKGKLFFKDIDGVVCLPANLVPRSERGEVLKGVQEHVQSFLGTRCPVTVRSCKSELRKGDTEIRFFALKIRANHFQSLYSRHLTFLFDLKYSKTHGNSIVLRLFSLQPGERKDKSTCRLRNISKVLEEREESESEGLESLRLSDMSLHPSGVEKSSSLYTSIRLFLLSNKGQETEMK